MTQLDAVAIYKNYKENKEKTIDQFEKILACGFSKPIDKLYEIAGIKFDFTKKYVKEIVDFIIKEIEVLDLIL